MKLSELEKRYRQLMSVPFSQLSQYNKDERVGLLYEEGPIRIFLVRSSTCEDYIKIEIEFQTCPSLERVKGREKIDFLDTMVSKIHYLRKLLFHGFHLDIIENSCIWTLQKKFIEEINQTDLCILLPE